MQVNPGVQLLCGLAAAPLVGLVLSRLIYHRPSKRPRKPLHAPSRRAEYDRHPAYVCMHIADVGLAVGLILGRVPPHTALYGLPVSLQHGMASAMGIGSTVALVGAATGTNIFKRLATSYVWGLSGCLGAMLGMSGYALTIFLNSDLIGTLGGAFAIMVPVAFGLMAFRKFRPEIQRLGELHDSVSNEVMNER